MQHKSRQTFLPTEPSGWPFVSGSHCVLAQSLKSTHVCPAGFRASVAKQKSTTALGLSGEKVQMQEFPAPHCDEAQQRCRQVVPS
jgi:hypothetical protein